MTVVAADLSALTDSDLRKRAHALTQKRKEAERRDPLAFYRPFAHQAAFHASPAKERWFVAGNRSGKTVAGAAEVVRLITGAADWWHGGPAEVWCGAVSLADSEAIQRRAIRALLPRHLVSSWVGEKNPMSESLLILKNGWRVRFKAHSQGRDRWQGVSVPLVWFDEEPDGDVFDEGYTRTIDCGGRVIVTFTPLNGLKWEDGYKRAYVPWQEFSARNPGARWGEVAPGVFVCTAAMSDNPCIPRAEIDAMRERYAHRPLMLRVRIGGEWLNVAEDAVVPVDKLREWDGGAPKGGWQALAVWVDSAFSAKETSDRFAVALAGRSHDGRLYLLRQEFGRFDADERVRVLLRFLTDCAADPSIGRVPSVYVQRTTPDMEFAARANDALMRAGMRAAVECFPAKGPVPGKVERAHAFAVAVGAGQVYILPEHREFRREASVFPHGAHDDVFDAGMGALMVLTEAAPSGSLEYAMRHQVKREGFAPDDDDPRPDWMPDYSWLREAG